MSAASSSTVLRVRPGRLKGADAPSGPQSRPASGLRSRPARLERLFEVVPEIVDVLAADADAQEVLGDDLALGGVAGASLERALDSTEAGGVREDPHRVDERVGTLRSAARTEGEHEAWTAERGPS